MPRRCTSWWRPTRCRPRPASSSAAPWSPSAAPEPPEPSKMRQSSFTSCTYFVARLRLIRDREILVDELISNKFGNLTFWFHVLCKCYCHICICGNDLNACSWQSGNVVIMVSIIEHRPFSLYPIFLDEGEGWDSMYDIRKCGEAHIEIRSIPNKSTN